MIAERGGTSKVEGSKPHLQEVVATKLKVLKHLPTGDLSLIVLKGHLLIEELLHDVVANRTKNRQSVIDARLGFFQLAQIAKALTYEKGFDPIWEAIFALNSLRNTFAHTLDTPDLEKKLRAFARAAAPNNQAEAEKLVLADPEKQIGDGIEFMCGALSALAFVV